MDKKLSFNENVINYEKYRPRYCEALFSKVIDYANITPTKKVIEVGCGTGQATKAILDTDCFVTAIEIGPKFVEFTKEKFKNYPNFNIKNIAFEDFIVPSASVDVIFSATAFHWIKEDIGYPKAFDLLKSGGSLAVFWNRAFVNTPDDMLHQAIQAIYEKYQRQGYFPMRETSIENNLDRFQLNSERIAAYGFEHVEHDIYHQTRNLNSEEYLLLLDTYSDHQTLPIKIKNELYNVIALTIKEHSDNITIHDTMDLYIAKKP